MHLPVWVLSTAFAWPSPADAVQALERPRYEISGSIQIDRQLIKATGRLAIPRAALGVGRSLQLSLHTAGRQRIGLTSVRDQQGRSLSGNWSSDSLTVTLLVPAQPDPLVIRVDFTVPVDSAGRRSLGYNLFSSVDSSDTWYPLLASVPDSLKRFLDFSVELEVPAGIAVLTTGSTTDTTRTASGTRYRFRADHVEGFALAFGEGLAVQALGSAGTRVKVISPVTDTAVFRRVAEQTHNAADWYRKTYGFFPVDEIGIVPGYGGARGGFPLPNVFMIHRGDLSLPFVRWITAHELAHYYWGLHVLDSRERLGWLMLGLGIWTDQLYLADVTRTRIEAVWRSPSGDNSFDDFAQAMVAGYDQRLDLPAEAADSLPYDYNSLVRHGKAATGIYLLALRLGTDRFVALQKELLETFRYRPLTAEAFAARLETAGVPNAAGFLQAWTRGDARLDYVVRGIRREPGTGFAYWLQIERTGTVPYPVTVEARSGSTRTRLQLTGEPMLDSIRIVLPGTLDQLQLDPDGLLPMWSSDHPDMQRVFLRALGRAGPPRLFLSLAHERVQHDPDPELLSLMVERWFEMGEWQEILTLASAFPSVERCQDRVSCLAALQVARARLRLGPVDQARALLEQLAPAMTAFGLAGSRRLRLARQELEERRGQP